ncbi:MAG: hypothetical protein IPN59_01350 [Holophaga sp.]|nr:hypothetical protein [Holophaga sp.]
MRIQNLLLSLLLSAPLAAQVLEPSLLGVQARISIPEGSFRDALGGLRLPGYGGSLMAEFDFGDSVHWRGVLGVDRWPQGKGNLASENREIQAFHLGAEGMYFLRDEGALKAKGPYVVGGLGAYSWSLGKDVTGSAQTRRTTHMAGTLGLGWRLAGHLDGEVKALVGVVEPGITAMVLMGCITYRF